MQCPLDYSLCNQTVTVYRLEGSTVQRQIIWQAQYQFEVQESCDREGKTRKTTCLLIIPGQADLRPGDRVYPGVGPIVTARDWAGFLPVRIPGLSQIHYVKPRYWDGRVCHTEAGSR